MSSRTPKWLALALTILAGIALLAFVACGDDDDDSKTSTPTGTGQSNGGDATDAPDAPDGSGGDETDEPTDTPDGNGGNGDGGDSLAELEDLGIRLEAAPGTVTYEITTDGDVSNIKFYSDAGKTRYDSIETDGEVTSYISTGDGTVVCSTSDETCIQYPGIGGIAINPFALFLSSSTVSAYIAAASIAGVDVEKSEETIAGTDVECFSWEDPAGDLATGKFCFNGNGAMLYQEVTTSSGTTKIQATEYSESVSDSDFEVPYPVTTIPGIPGQ